MDKQRIVRELKDRVIFSHQLNDFFGTEEPVTIGGEVVHHIDLSRFGLPYKEKDEKKPIKTISDAYVTIDDGLGSINLFLPGHLYQEMLELYGEPKGKIILFKGFPVEFDRKTVNPKTLQEFRSDLRPNDIRVYVSEVLTETSPPLF